MVYYCSTADVGSRLALDSAQRTRAGSRLTGAIRRATIDIDKCIVTTVEMPLQNLSRKPP